MNITASLVRGLLIACLLFQFVAPIQLGIAQSQTPPTENAPLAQDPPPAVEERARSSLQAYLETYALEHGLQGLSLRDLVFEGDRAYAVAVHEPDPSTTPQPNNAEVPVQDGESVPEQNTVGFILEQTEDQSWSITPTAETFAAQNIVIDVPFTSQLLPGATWKLTMTCGQTSSAMLFAKYGFYNHSPATSNDIIAINSWLATRHGLPGFATPNSLGTSVAWLADLAKEYAGFEQSYYASWWDTTKIKEQIQAGRPVIVGVYTNMNASEARHFMIVKGVSLDNSGKVLGVYVADPGKSLSNPLHDTYYDVTTFEAAWTKQNRSVTMIIPDSDPQPPQNMCAAPTNGLPRDTYVYNQQQVTFSWHPEPCDSLSSYRIRVANHYDVQNNPFIDEVINKDLISITKTIPTQYNGQTLYWAIWPINSKGQGPIGGPWSFKIDTTSTPKPDPLPTGGWNIETFGNKELNGQCTGSSSFDQTFVYKEWGDASPGGSCPSDNFSARFSRSVYFPGGQYDFWLDADDWGRIYVDGQLFVNKWNGASQHHEGYYVSPGNHNVVVEFADTAGFAYITAWWTGPGFNVPEDMQYSDQWYANYWINQEQRWNSFAKVNEGYGKLNHDWGSGSPGYGIPGDHFSAKFNRNVFFECGRYRFVLDHDDGARFSIDSVRYIDRWPYSGYDPVEVSLSEGLHALQVDYNENGGGAKISLDWQKLSGCSPDAPALYYPSNGSSLASSTALTLSWGSAAGAMNYLVTLYQGQAELQNSGWITGTDWYAGTLWPGTYTWKVTAANTSGSTVSYPAYTFTIEQPPVQPPTADFSVSPASGTAPLTVTFTNLSTGDYSTCAWAYGDGLTGSSCNETHAHTYQSPGTYNVSLTVTGTGSNTRTISAAVQVSSAAAGCPAQISGWEAKFWSNPDLSGAFAKCRDDFQITQDWGTAAPDPAVQADNFSAQWTRVVNFSAGTYRFKVDHDDGARLYVDNMTTPLLDAWGTCCEWNQAEKQLSAGSHTIRLQMRDTGGAAYIRMYWEPVIIGGWRGEYYNNTDMSGPPVLVRDDPVIGFQWYDGAPDPLVAANQFSVRWSREITLIDDDYEFIFYHDDGARMYLDGVLLMNNWCDNCGETEQAIYHPGAGTHTVVLEMWENWGWSGASFNWRPLNPPPNGLWPQFLPMLVKK